MIIKAKLFFVRLPPNLKLGACIHHRECYEGCKIGVPAHMQNTIKGAERNGAGGFKYHFVVKLANRNTLLGKIDGYSVLSGTQHNSETFGTFPTKGNDERRTLLQVF